MKRALLPFVMLTLPVNGSPQTIEAPPSGTKPYSMTVSVKEVQIRFHGTDEWNHPVKDLKPEEVDVFDDGKGPGTIVGMHRLQDLPLRVAFVLDTSGSIISQFAHAREEAREIASTLMTQGQDQAMVVTFDRSRHVSQSWTRNKADVLDNLSSTAHTVHNPVDGTSVYDTVLNICMHDFDQDMPANATNTVLLFSDGEDTSSKIALETAIEACRRSQTAVYAFGAPPISEEKSAGMSVLRALTEQTGGSLFISNDAADGAKEYAAQLASELRSEYVLFYRPSGLLRDGKFHQIVLAGPKRVVSISGTPGFYAPATSFNYRF